MSDKYYRLVSLIMNICPLPLRELFHICSKNDVQFTAPYSAHDYLLFRQKEIRAARNISPDQFEKIYPRNGQTDVSNWDITLLALTLKRLFAGQISQTILDNIDIIRDLRNEIQHLPSASSMSDADFSKYWNALEDAVLALAKDIKGSTYKENMRREIEKALISNMPDLGSVLCKWYEEKSLSLEYKIQELQTGIKEQRETYEKELNDLKTTLKDVSQSTRSTNTMLDKGSRKHTSYSGKSYKRFKTVDSQQDVMQRKFSETIRHGLPIVPIPSSQKSCITKKLSEDHFVVVCGTRNSLYFQVALTAIEEMGYAKDRCFELTEASDWWRVSFEEADCIVVVNPFGKRFFDRNKASAMSDIFDSMLSSTKEESLREFKFHDIVIITEMTLLYDCVTDFPHDILKAEIKIPESEITEETSEPALGDVPIDDDNYSADPVANKELKYIKEIKISNPDGENADIDHICMIPPNRLALTDRSNNSLKLMNITNGEITSIQLHSVPGAIAVLSEHKIAVVLNDDNLIQLFSTYHGLKKSQSIRVNEILSCITYVNGMLYAFFCNHYIQTYNLKGEILETVTIDPKIKDSCSYWLNVSVCPNKTSFYISDFENHLLFRINLKGELIAVYKNKDLDNPAQVLASSDGSVFLCNSYTVLQMRADLTRPRVILGRSDNVLFPYGICYLQEKNIIIISCRQKDSENIDTLKYFSINDTNQNE